MPTEAGDHSHEPDSTHEGTEQSCSAFASPDRACSANNRIPPDEVDHSTDEVSEAQDLKSVTNPVGP